MSREAELPDDLGWYAFNYRTAHTMHAKEMYLELAAFVEREKAAAYQAGMERAAQKVEEIEARCEAMDMDDPPLKEVAEEIRAEGKR
jgi:hypothetical protein